MRYSTLDFDLQFTDKSVFRFSFTPLDPTKLGDIKGNIDTFNEDLKLEEPDWYDFIANESGAKVDTDAGIVAATITTYNETTIL